MRASAARRTNAAADFLEANLVAGRAEKAAFIDLLHVLSFGELHQRARLVGPMLQRPGVVAENRVALVLLDTVDFPIAFWLYSSGTTGRPKAAMHVHSTPRHIARLAGDALLGIGAPDARKRVRTPARPPADGLLMASGPGRATSTCAAKTACSITCAAKTACSCTADTRTTCSKSAASGCHRTRWRRR